MPEIEKDNRFNADNPVFIEADNRMEDVSDIAAMDKDREHDKEHDKDKSPDRERFGDHEDKEDKTADEEKL